jgi:hypothetical protein
MGKGNKVKEFIFITMFLKKKCIYNRTEERNFFLCVEVYCTGLFSNLTTHFYNIKDAGQFCGNV